MSTDPTLELAALIGTAIAQTGGTDREAMRDVAVQVIQGPDRVAQRLGTAIASAVLTALQTPMPKGKPGDPIATAEARHSHRQVRHDEWICRGVVATFVAALLETAAWHRRTF